MNLTCQTCGCSGPPLAFLTPGSELRCPGCGVLGDAALFCAEPIAKRALLKALEMPADLAGRLAQYLALHNPPLRRMTGEQADKILGELLTEITTAQVTWERKTYAAPIEYWKAAFDELFSMRDGGKLRLPLKGHGLLRSILAGHAEQAAAKTEAKQHEAAQRGTGRPHEGGLRPVGETVAPKKRGPRTPPDEFLELKWSVGGKNYPGGKDDVG